MEKWKEEFDYKFTMIGHKGIWGHVNSVDDVKAFVEKVRQEAIREVIDTLESEPRMTSSQMVRHVRAKFL